MASLRRDHSVGQVRLVCYEYLGHSTARMGLYLLQPVLDVIKSALLGAIIDKNDAHGAFIVGLGDSTEALLPRSVPYLKLHSLVLHVDSFDLKVDADGGHVARWEVVF